MKNLLGLTACDTVTLMVVVDCGNVSGMYSLDIIGSTGDYINDIDVTAIQECTNRKQ